MKHKEFSAMAQGRGDYSEDVIPIDSKEYGMMMCICSEEAAIYITKEQAMSFFGLVEENNEDK